MDLCLERMDEYQKLGDEIKEINFKTRFIPENEKLIPKGKVNPNKEC